MADGSAVLGRDGSPLKSRGIAFSPGLTDAAVAAVEAHFAFRFPPDLRSPVERPHYHPGATR
jgi:hypothetical protein